MIPRLEREKRYNELKKFKEALENDRFEKKWKFNKADNACQALQELFNV